MVFLLTTYFSLFTDSENTAHGLRNHYDRVGGSFFQRTLKGIPEGWLPLAPGSLRLTD